MKTQFFRPNAPNLGAVLAPAHTKGGKGTSSSGTGTGSKRDRIRTGRDGAAGRCGGTVQRTVQRDGGHGISIQSGRDFQVGPICHPDSHHG